MISLIFKLFSWQEKCQSGLVLFFLRISPLFFCLLIILLIINIFYYFIWCKKIYSDVKEQQMNLEASLALIDAGKISFFVINSIKNYLTSLRLILDIYKNPKLIKDEKQFNNHRKTAETLLYKIKQREDLLNRQIQPKVDMRLFDLVYEINKIVDCYRDTLKENNIKLTFHSDKEYRIFANEDHLLLVLNTTILKTIEVLILSKVNNKSLKIYFIKSAYLLKIFIENNAEVINSRMVSSSVVNNNLNTNFFKINNLSLYFVNKIMHEYFHKKIAISNKTKTNTKIILKIKSSFILAETKIK